MSRMPSESEITRLLNDASAGRDGALDQVVQVVYDELAAIAHRQRRRESAGHTLDTNAVLHEAWIQLRDMGGMEWQSRAHFYGVAGRVMGRVLIRYARDRQALKRGGGASAVSLSQVELFTDAEIEQLVAVDDLLEKVDALGPRSRSVVEGRVFAAMTFPELAEHLGVSLATVKRDWALARAWLNDALQAEAGGAP